MRQFKGPLMLLCTAMIWGSSFVAQRVGGGYVGPVLFQSIRILLGALILLPVILIRRKQGAVTLPVNRKACLWCGVVLGTAAVLQQIGMQQVSAGKSGFISALYVILVPIFSQLLGSKVNKGAWIGAPLALLGLYLMSSEGSFSFSFYEWVIVISAVGYSAHILVVGHFSDAMDGIELSFYQYLIAGLIYLPVGLMTEWHTLGGLSSAAVPILYAGLLSCGIATTLQVVGQKYTPSAIAALIMCLESVFSAVSGALILGERMSGRELTGCGVMLFAVVLSQVLGMRSGKKAGA